MSDQTMKDIKAGVGLKPLSSSGQPATKPAGTTSEQRIQSGVTRENFTRNTGKGENK